MIDKNPKSDRVMTSAVEWFCSRPRCVWSAVGLLLAVHAGLLAYSATRHSPTVDEPAHLVAGLCHWKFGRFELYRVNPPLVRMIAALPVIVAGYEEDWSGFSESPGARSAFSMGPNFLAANGERSIWLFTIARWACIPISLIGGLFCFLWSREMWGHNLAGLISLTLWCFEPNILAHGELITPDCAATSFGLGAGYFFWRWLQKQTWERALAAGVLLGLAKLSKMTWVILFGLWPLLWLFWLASGRRKPADDDHNTPDPQPSTLNQSAQLLAILLVGLYLLNLGYDFDGTFRKLKDFTFVSSALTGEEESGVEGNRFVGTLLGSLPVPLPEQYLLGIDVQKHDFEQGRWSYLAGEFRKRGGWWYYYLYAAVVKVPLGIWLLAAIVLVSTVFGPSRMNWREALPLCAPPLVVFVLVSAETGFSRHFRYVLPALPFLFVWAGQVATFWVTTETGESGLSPGAKERKLTRLRHIRIAGGVLAALGVVWSVSSSLACYPHSLSYFNELGGGSRHGHRHLIHSNIDWGQDLFYLREWITAHPEARPLTVAYHGGFDETILGVNFPRTPETLQPGWHAVSVNKLRDISQRYEYFLSHQPAASAGHSIFIYHVPPDASRQGAD